MVDSSSFEARYRKEREVVPQAVVESRMDRKPPEFTPEVMFNNQNWIVGPPEATHEKAMKVAETRSEAVRLAAIAGGMASLAGCRKAKE